MRCAVRAWGFLGNPAGGNGVQPFEFQPRSDPVPARNRCLCQSRPVIGLAGWIIQLKRFGLMIKRFVRGLWGFLVTVFLWLLSLPARIVRGLWISLFWPTQPHSTAPPCRKVDDLHKLSEPPKPAWNGPDSPTDWERFLAWSGKKLNRSWRIGKLHIRRAARHAKLAFRERTAWTFATVSGSLGILLMIFLQLMYSFQTLKATEHAGLTESREAHLKTRVDPGFPAIAGIETHLHRDGPNRSVCGSRRK